MIVKNEDQARKICHRTIGSETPTHCLLGKCTAWEQVHAQGDKGPMFLCQDYKTPEEQEPTADRELYQWVLESRLRYPYQQESERNPKTPCWVGYHKIDQGECRDLCLDIQVEMS